MKLLIRLLLCGTVLSSHSFAVASYFLASEKFKKYYSEFVAPDGYSLVDVTNGSQFLAKNQTGGWIVGNLEGEYSELPDLSAIANLTSLVGADASSYRFIGEQLYSTLYYPRSETYNLRPQVSVLIEHGDDQLIATPILSSDDSISTLLVAREPNSDVYLIREFFVGRNEYSFLNMEGNVRTTIETLLAPHFASIEPLSLNFRGSTLSGVAVFLVRGSDGS